MQPSHNEHWTIVQSNELTTKRRDQWLLSSGRKVCPHNFPVGNGKCCWSNSMSTFLWNTSNRNDMAKQYVHQSLSKHFDQPLTWTNSTSTNHWPNTLTKHSLGQTVRPPIIDQTLWPITPLTYSMTYDHWTNSLTHISQCVQYDSSAQGQHHTPKWWTHTQHIRHIRSKFSNQKATFSPKPTKQ